MINHILAPIDGSPSSIKALDYAAHLADQNKAKLTIISAAEPLPPFTTQTTTPAYYPQYQQDLHKHLTETQQTQKTRLEEKYSELEIETTVKDGRPTAIIQKASENTDLVVIGHRGHGAILSLLLGSTAKKVVDTSKAPVLVVKDQDYTP